MDQKNVTLREQYLKKTLKITPYVPFVEKIVFADAILKVTMLDKESGRIHVDSNSEFLMMVRCFVEKWTNLKVENPGFHDEYDVLKVSGIFDKLFFGNPDAKEDPLIPYTEVVEFKEILARKREDLLTNRYEPHAYITEQVERFANISGIVIKPVLDRLADSIANLDDAKIDKIANIIKSKVKNTK